MALSPPSSQRISNRHPVFANEKSDDRFTAALKARLEDVGAYCSNEFTRLKSEVTRLKDESVSLRLELADLQKANDSSDNSPENSKSPGKRSSESPKSHGSELDEQARISLGLSIPAGRAGRDSGLRKSRASHKDSSGSPEHRKRHFARTSTECFRSERAQSCKSVSREATEGKYQQLSRETPASSQGLQIGDRREERASSHNSQRHANRCPSADSSLKSPRSERSQRRHKTSPAQAKSTSARPGSAGSARSFSGLRLQIPDGDSSKMVRETDPNDTSTSTRSVSEAAALAAAMVNKNKSSPAPFGGMKQTTPDSPDGLFSSSDDDGGSASEEDLKSGCGEKSCSSVDFAGGSFGPSVLQKASEPGVHTPTTPTRQVSAPARQVSPLSPIRQVSPPGSMVRVDSLRSRPSTQSSAFVFEPLPYWQDRAIRRKRIQKTRRSIDVCKELLMEVRAKEKGEETNKCTCIPQRWMIAPTHLRCIVFDLIGVVLIGYELVFLPMQVFDMPGSGFWTGMDWVQRIFWTVAIVRGFFVGYVAQDGSVELRPGKVAKNYLLTWLPFDIVMMFTDWMEVLMSGTEFVSAARVTKTIRFTRVIRIFRLARMAKLPRLLEEFDARFISERTILLLGIVKITFIFACVCHLIACLWYGLGRYWSYDERSWVYHHNVLNETTAYQYTTSLHWALSQFQGSMEVMPENTYERNYAVCVLVLTFVSASVFVSRITAAYTRLQIIAGGNERKFSELRTFLRANNISSSLAMRVMRSAQFAVNQAIKQMAEEDIELLQSITEPLRIEIHFEMFGRHLMVHPFFRWMCYAHGGAMRHLCQSAVQVLAVSQGDLLFSEGEEAMNPRMFFVMTGNLSYNCDLDEVAVGKGTWFSEGTLWLQWVHVGDLLAMSEGQICALRADLFQETTCKFYELASVCVKYAAAYCKKLNMCPLAICDLHRGYIVEELMDIALRDPSLQHTGSGSTGAAPNGRKLSWTCTNADHTMPNIPGYDMNGHRHSTFSNGGNNGLLGIKVLKEGGRRISSTFGMVGSLTRDGMSAVSGAVNVRLASIMRSSSTSRTGSRITPERNGKASAHGEFNELPHADRPHEEMPREDVLMHQHSSLPLSVIPSCSYSGTSSSDGLGHPEERNQTAPTS